MAEKRWHHIGEMTQFVVASRLGAMRGITHRRPCRTTDVKEITQTRQTGYRLSAYLGVRVSGSQGLR